MAEEVHLHPEALTMLRSYRRFFKLFAGITKAIDRDEDLNTIAACIVRSAAEILAASGSTLWMLDDSARRLETLGSFGNPFSSIADPDYLTLQRLFDFSKDVRLAGLPFSCCVDGYSMTAAEAGAIGANRVVLAVWSLDGKTPDMDQLDMLLALAEQGALALQRSSAPSENDTESHLQIVESMLLALKAKDDLTYTHSFRTGAFARRIGAELGLSDEKQEMLYHGGLLHDIGKIGVANAILAKLGAPKLSAGEIDIIRKHPDAGAKILAPLTNLQGLLPMVLHHHEWFDGSGFPAGLAGNQIPLSARIITVCDAFETMLSGRMQLASMSLSDSIASLEQGAGKQFDPTVVLALFAALEKAPEYFAEPKGVPQKLDQMLKRLSLKIVQRKVGGSITATSAVYF